MKSYKEHLKEVWDLYNHLFPEGAVKVRSLRKEKMELVSDEELTNVDLREKLNYYNYWLAFFQDEYKRWKFISERLDRKYKTEYAKFIATEGSGKRYEREAEAKVELSSLEEALGIAEQKFENSKQDVNTANNYKEMISRLITLRGYELQSIGRE